MGTEQLYFVIGFLLGAIITGCLCMIGFIAWHEWFYRSPQPEEQVQVYIWTLVVLVLGDGEWRDWNSYNRLEECLEVVQVITYRRENQIQARCERREVKKELLYEVE